MAMIKVRDLAYARLQSPDLDAQEEFLTAFGMVRAARIPTALYMRGTDPAHHIHVIEAVIRSSFHWLCVGRDKEDDLSTISKLPGASGIETIDEPGGGKRVRPTEPNGTRSRWSTASRPHSRSRSCASRSTRVSHPSIAPVRAFGLPPGLPV